MRRGCSIEDFLKPLGNPGGYNQVFLTNSVQVADIIEWVVRQIGTSEVWITTFSISEEFLRRLFSIKKSGLIKKINIVIDHKATQKTVKLWSFMRNVVDNVYLADNHSKIILFKAGNTVVSVVTSQNLTRGNRYESTMVSRDRQMYESLMTSINDISTNYSINFNELYDRAITKD